MPVNLVSFEGDPTTLITDSTADEATAYLEVTLAFDEIASGDGWVAYRNPDVR